MGCVTLSLLLVIGTAILWKPMSVRCITCGETPAPNTDNGIIQSFNYPYAYANNENCQWIIKVPSGYVIRLTFYTPFNLEEGDDYVTVYEYSPSGKRTFRNEWTGYVVPSPFLSITNTMDIRFTTSYSTVYKGFRLLWEKWAGAITCGMDTVGNADSGYVMSPHYPDPYGNHERCKTVISVSSGNVIKLTFSSPFQIQYDHDYLKLSEIDSSGKRTSLRSWTGNNTPPVYTSSSNKVELYLISDEAVAYKGFHVLWEKLEFSKLCEETYKSSNGTFSSPGFPDFYPTNLDCKWEIHVSPGQSVQLEFGTPFDMEIDKHGCQYDYIEVFDFSTNDERISHGRWCGVRKMPVFQSISSKMLVVFKSDYDKSGQGFVASWKTVVSQRSQECDNVYMSANGSFTTPGFPKLSPPKLNCQWKINVAPGKRIKLELGTPSGLDSDSCGYDYVEAFDFFTNGTQISNGRWCSFSKVPVIYSISSKMVVVFRSDNNQSRQGFTASWSTVSGCGDKISSGAGHLLSPNFPKQYPVNEECRWELTPPVGTNFTLHFDTIFDLELSNSCAWDYLQMKLDGSSIGQYCGNNRPQDVKVTGGQKLDIVFKSDKSTTGKGFFASWTYDK